MSILLALCCFVIPAKSQNANYPLAITISPENSTVQLPKNRKDFFEIRFKGTIENQGLQDIKVVSPEAQQIIPHPYLINANGVEARFWDGSFCAPSFKQEDMIVLKAGGKLNFKFLWHIFIHNFSQKPGKYSFSVRYSYKDKDNFIVGVPKEGLTEIESSWSNEVEVEILDD